MLQPPSSANYVEMIRCSISYEGDEAIVAKTPNKEEFDRLLMRCTNYFKHAKVFDRQYKQFVLNNLYYNIVKSTGEVSVCSLNPICTYDMPPSLVGVCYEKKKLSIMNFPSTLMYDNIVEVKKTVLRINNRLYINFEEQKDVIDDTTSYHVYANYNHDSHVDWDTVKGDLQKVVKIISS